MALLLNSFISLLRSKTNKPVFFIGVVLFIVSRVSFAEIIIVAPNTIIEKDTTYHNVILDLSHGSFLITKNASLKIENSIINGSISPDNPFLINVTSGNLILKNNTFNVISTNIPANPNHPPLNYLINISQGVASIIGNRFTTNKFYTVGFLASTRSMTSDLNINDNDIRNLHGGILLRNSYRAHILNNKFINVSSSNIYIIGGSHHLIKGNVILFSGNNNIGDGVDLSDTENTSLSENYILSGSCYSVVILRCKNILIDRNKIVGGITYAIYITYSEQLVDSYHKHFLRFSDKDPVIDGVNENITITNNYLSQNRFGLAARVVHGLTVKNNVFIQWFRDSHSRKFWTDNDVLLQDINNVIWEDNLYKEAYPQQTQGNDEKSSKFVIFPMHGGVSL